MIRATLIGLSTFAMWAPLAMLTALSGSVPPFQLSAIAFAIGTAVGILAQIMFPSFRQNTRIPPMAWLVGIAGLFGYHFLYFTALKNAPAVEANLISYLWPLLIVLGSALMPGERLGWHHIAGAAAGLCGTALIVAKDGGLAFESRYALGYAAAATAALFWSSYSLLSRRFGEVPTSTVTWFCGATAILSAVCHILLEETVWPATTGEWTAVVLMGVFPLGAAFFTWDYGVKHGNIQLIGTASYIIPMLSTLLLIAAGRAEPTLNLLIACLLITGGAALAAKNIILRPRAKAPTPAE
ncbi:EamA family transporter [Chelativorans composti]|jgi:Permeases of the drug/metabolite transporter (DMT) superfamily|uniref:DMT family transporter n=1 Tax=Chelativorans composti TaxID=768533 RepID=A0ABW5DF37_9HYPH